MARRGSSFGFLGRFGRSGDLRQLDQALRAADLHPALVPEGVKLALVNLIKDHFDSDDPPAEIYPHAAHLLAYCMVGAEAFAVANGPSALAEVQARVDAAVLSGEGPDAGIVLLAYHAGLLQPEVVERHGISVAAED
jgi:hypothetical protein